MNYLGGAAVELQGSLERVAWLTVWVTFQTEDARRQGADSRWRAGVVAAREKDRAITEMAVCRKSHCRASDMWHPGQKPGHFSDFLHQGFGFFAHLLTGGFMSSVAVSFGCPFRSVLHSRVQTPATLSRADPRWVPLGQGTEKHEHSVSSSGV